MVTRCQTTKGNREQRSSRGTNPSPPCFMSRPYSDYNLRLHSVAVSFSEFRASSKYSAIQTGWLLGGCNSPSSYLREPCSLPRVPSVVVNLDLVPFPAASHLLWTVSAPSLSHHKLVCLFWDLADAVEHNPWLLTQLWVNKDFLLINICHKMWNLK